MITPTKPASSVPAAARSNGPRTTELAILVHGQMFEDHAVECSAFRPAGRLFCVASAGCTALALAAQGHDVVALDRNPAQIEYLHSRLAGGPVRQGTVEYAVERSRKALPWLGLSLQKLQYFLNLDDPIDQVLYWRGQLDTTAWRTTLDHAVQGGLLQNLYWHRTEAVRLPAGFGAVFRKRLERCWAIHPNRTNPYAWRLFANVDPPGYEPPQAIGRSLTPVCEDLVTYLMQCPAGSFDGFSLSHIFDGVTPEHRNQIWQAVRRAAKPDAVVVWRSAFDPAPGVSNNVVERDRSLLWGMVKVQPVGI